MRLGRMNGEMEGGGGGRWKRSGGGLGIFLESFRDLMS
jgi:hypothetical protein